MSIVTKTGDGGATSLMYNRRVSKCDPRVKGSEGVAKGSVKGSVLGIVLATLNIQFFTYATTR